MSFGAPRTSPSAHVILTCVHALNTSSTFYFHLRKLRRTKDIFTGELGPHAVAASLPSCGRRLTDESMAAVVEESSARTTDKAGPGSLAGQQNGVSSVPQPYVFQSSHEYPSASAAEMVMKTLSVDPELRPQLVTRRLSVQGSTLKIQFSATDAKTMQAAVGTFYDLLKLATETLEAFGPEADSLPAANGQL